MKKSEIKISYILSFLIPVLIWIVVCILHGIYPFGNKSIMTGDITYQFIDYLSYFKTIILGSNDFSYTFSKTIGGDMAGFSAYYLFSPFNFLLLFFDNDMLPLGLLLIIIIKCGCMSLFFNIMLTKLYGYKRESLIFAISYSLMGYVVVYFQLYAYFDDMMLLPLIVCGIHSLLENPRKKLLYIVILTMSICLNYYIGYMLCIFSLLYFIYQLILQKKGKQEILAFCIASLYSGLMSMFVLIPSILSLRGEKNSFHLGFYLTMDITQFFSRFYTDSFKGNISTCMPNIYCGVLMVVLLVLYFLNKKIEKREKICSAVFLLFLILNFYINTLNVAWHGFNSPIGFPYRYSFMFTFLVLLLAYRSILNPDNDSIIKKAIAIIAVYIIYSAYILISGNEVIGIREVIINAALLIAVLGVICFSVLNKVKPIIILLLLFMIQIADLSENIYHSFYFFELADMGEYVRYVDRVGACIDEIKQSDDSLYRIEKYFKRSHNDSMQFNYAGMTHYSSCEKKEVISYMKKMGMRDNGNWSFYDSGSTVFVDSLFGIKYLLSQHDYTAKKFKRFSNVRYEDEYGKVKYFTFENKYALPLIIASDSDILSMDDTFNNTFDFQQRIADAIVDENITFFHAANTEKSLHNLNMREENGNTIYEKIDSNEDAYIQYSLVGTEETKTWMLWGYFDAPDYQNAIIEMNGDEKGDYFSEYNWNAVDLGKHDPGEDIIVKIKLTGDTLTTSGEYLYFEDIPTMRTWVDKVRENNCELQMITSSHLKGSASLKEDGCILFTFPYEKGWQVYIDGQKAETQSAAGLFLAAEASAGNHNIELKYIQEGRREGIIISVLALFVVIYLEAVLPRRKKNASE